MTYIKTISESEAGGLLKKIYDASSTRAGEVANIIKMMSLDSRVTQTSMMLYVSLMKSENALPAAQREMLATVVSNVNGCYY